MSLVLTDFLTNHIKCSLILEPCFPNSPWPERRLKSRAISSEPDLAFEDDKGSELEAESEVVSELAAGDPKNSDTSNGGAPEEYAIIAPIKMAEKIIDELIMVICNQMKDIRTLYNSFKLDYKYAMQTKGGGSTWNLVGDSLKIFLTAYHDLE